MLAADSSRLTDCAQYSNSSSTRGAAGCDHSVPCAQVYVVNTNRTDVLLLVGAIYYQLGNYEQCIAFNDRCILLDPHMVSCRTLVCEGAAFWLCLDAAGSIRQDGCSVVPRELGCGRAGMAALKPQQTCRQGLCCQ